MKHDDRTCRCVLCQRVHVVAWWRYGLWWRLWHRRGASTADLTLERGHLESRV